MDFTTAISAASVFVFSLFKIWEISAPADERCEESLRKDWEISFTVSISFKIWGKCI